MEDKKNYILLLKLNLCNIIKILHRKPIFESKRGITVYQEYPWEEAKEFEVLVNISW